MATNALGQRPKFEKKLVGIVEYVTGEHVAKFTLTEEGKTFANGTKSLKVNLDELPSAPRLAPNDKTGKQLRIRMSTDGTEVEALTPVTGVFNLKLTGIGPRPEKDADPTPKERVWNEGTEKENRYLEFFAVYQIIDGKFKGVTLPAYNMHYKFEEDSNNPGFTRYAGNFDNKKATRLFQLRDWMQIHGIDSDPIEWDDVTILPTLLERALDNGVQVRGVFKNGYVTELLPLDEEDVEPFLGDIVDKPVDEDDLDDVTKIEVKEEPKAQKQEPKVLTTTSKKVSKNKPVKVVADEDDDL